MSWISRVVFTLVSVSNVISDVGLTLSRYQIIRYHNVIRKHERAAGMNYMYWDEKLASKAEHWTKHCYYQHEASEYGENLGYLGLMRLDNSGNMASEDDAVKFDGNSENMARNIQTSENTDAIVMSIMKTWYRQHTVYHWSNDSCRSSCEYTQMVWADSTSIGCAATVCGNMTTFGEINIPAIFMACYFWPRGNVVGQFPFTAGTSCSGCEPTDKCVNRLCHGRKKKVPLFKSKTHWTFNLNAGDATFQEVSELPQKDSVVVSDGNSEQCKDVFPTMCGEWVTNRQCVTMKKRMKHFCPASCKFCTPAAKSQAGILNDAGEDTMCLDRYDRRQCYIWATVGECTRNQEGMRRFCQKSCKLCDSDVAKSGAKKADDMRSIVCKDRLRVITCVRMRSEGMCTRSNMRKVMKHNCRKTCHMCLKHSGPGITQQGAQMSAERVGSETTRSQDIEQYTAHMNLNSNNWIRGNYTSLLSVSSTGQTDLTNSQVTGTHIQTEEHNNPMNGWLKDDTALNKNSSNGTLKTSDRNVIDLTSLMQNDGETALQKTKRQVVKCENTKPEKMCILYASRGYCYLRKWKMVNICSLTCNYKCFA